MTMEMEEGISMVVVLIDQVLRLNLLHYNLNIGSIYIIPKVIVHQYNHCSMFPWPQDQLSPKILD
jgi:hypothetical protein